MAPPSSPSSASSAATTSVQVALRIRPSNSHDASSIPPRFQRSVIHAATPTSVAVDPVSAAASAAGGSVPTGSTSAAAKKQLFTFDQVHGPTSTQHSIFTATALPLVSRFVDGFNCTILAYGQTSSGKTFTMTGIDLDANPSDPSNGMGIIPRAVSTIFSRARELKEERANTWNYTLKGSFIEIYNEELIDLLTNEENGGKREVQIREDKYGHIIWDGLREVSVKNSGEVMTLIRQGTSIRRTNETDMNATSSRSHAIFSLTLTQKKYTGSSSPPVRSSSPLPPTGRSPSRLTRPGSMYTGSAGAASRTSSPTFGRPSTPSFATAMRGGTAGGLRPPSSLGHRHEARAESEITDGNDWVTVVSKFHFVDLAGSERLKRTAAQGDRVKEGISINGGLLALGNVISALGDPSRAKSGTASYVPYRDSKLTRLLQDSLGGNAHTLMIACVSPAEWNAGETVNTLKYANRARNIKNRVTVNEREEGWDDVEWLQGMVTRLRKEMKGIKEGGGVANGTLAIGPPPTTAPPEVSVASGKVVAQMVELQNNYEDLREQFTQRTEELTRLRRELAEKQRSSVSSGGGMSKYEEIVGPVIEEYEKTISAMEAELSLNRAALRHTNELYEEKEEELTVLSDRHAATELYVEELRGRTARLSERESSTEAYIRDLEEKVKAYDETNTTSSESMSDLKREIIRFKDAESHSSQYIADLEARLARSDESIIALQQTVETLEKDSHRRRDEVETLQSRLESLTRDGQGWREDLADRELKMKELELKMREWESKKNEAGDERLRLGEIVDEVAKARRSLQLTVPINGNGVSLPESPASSPGPMTPTESAVETQLVSLQQTHTATLADLSSITSKYRDALREINDLSSQLEEMKLVSPTTAVDFPERTSSTEAPIFTRRKPVRNGSESQKRLFFRQAASAESLHSRSLSQSQSLSQELSSARLRKTSISSQGSTSSPGSHSPSVSVSRPNLSISLPPSIAILNGGSSPEKSVSSLEKEIMRLQEVLHERELEISLLEESMRTREQTPPAVNGRPKLDTTDSFVSAQEELPEDDGRSTPVIMTPTHARTLSPKTLNQFDAIRQTMNGDHVPSGTPDSDDSLRRLNELMRSMAQKESSHREIVDGLNEELATIRKQHDELTTLSRDQIHNMSAEIEALHGRHIDGLSQLEEVQDRETEVLSLLKKTKDEHASALDRLRSDHEDAMRTKEAEVDALVTRVKDEHQTSVDDLRDQLAQVSSTLDRAHQEHKDAFGTLKSEHEEALNRRSEEVKELLERMEKEHQEGLARTVAEHQDLLKQKDDESSSALTKLKEEHDLALELHNSAAKQVLEQAEMDHSDALSRATSKHLVALDQKTQEHNAAQEHIAEIETNLELVEKQHADALAAVSSDHADALTRKDQEANNSLQRTEEEYYNALSKLRADHAEAMEKQASEATLALDRLKEEHAGQLRMAEISKEGSLSETQSATEAAMQGLKDAHSLAISQKEANFAEDLERLKVDHQRTFDNTVQEHALVLEKARSEHSAALSKVQEESQQEIHRLNSLLEEAKASSVASKAKSRDELKLSLQTAQDKYDTLLRETQTSHQGELEKLKAAHQQSLGNASTQATELETSLLALHAAELEKVNVQHEAALADVHSTASASHALERQEFEAKAEELRISLIKSHEEELAALKANHQSTAGDVASRFEQQHAALSTQHVEELEKLKAAHATSLADSTAQLEQQRSELVKSHTEEMAKLKAEHQAAITEAESALVATQNQHRQALEDVRVQSEKVLSQEREQMKVVLADSDAQIRKERDTLKKDRDLLVHELATVKVALEDATIARKQAASKHAVTVTEKDGIINSVQTELKTTRSKQDDLAAEVSRLREELETTRNEQSSLLKEASKRDSLVEELEKHRSVLAETQTNLQRTKDEKDTIQAEKMRQDSLLRDLQAQISRTPTPPPPTPVRTTSDRERPTRQSSIPPAKPPPPTPPPSIPPPPTPRASSSSISSPGLSFVPMPSIRDSQMDSPAMSLAPSLIAPSLAHDSSTSSTDAKLQQQVEQQAKLLGEQETMIKTLNKQLTHCETDLQAHMDLVSTLETSLGDSEKNLRKARMHATELARERDTLNAQITSLRNELTEAKREVQSVRRSVVEEKQSLETRLDEERRAKERARSQLETRVEELQKRKSKFVCL